MSDYSRITYEFYKKNKICTQCRKRKTDGTMVTCKRCHELNVKRNERYKKEKQKKIKPMYFCYKCGACLNKNRLCDKCYEVVVIPEFIKNRR